MKKYNSPICEIEIFATPDVITSSSDTFRIFSFSNIGNLDDNSNIDKVNW